MRERSKPRASSDEAVLPANTDAPTGTCLSSENSTRAGCVEQEDLGVAERTRHVAEELLELPAVGRELCDPRRVGRLAPCAEGGGELAHRPHDGRAPCRGHAVAHPLDGVGLEFAGLGGGDLHEVVADGVLERPRRDPGRGGGENGAGDRAQSPETRTAAALRSSAAWRALDAAALADVGRALMSAWTPVHGRPDVAGRA